MRITTAFLLLGIGVFMTGCGSHEDKQARDGGRDAKNRAVVDNGRGSVIDAGNRIDDRNIVNSAPTCVSGPANQAVTAVDAATVRTEQVATDVNHAARQVQAEAQQTANDAAQLGNDATHAVNSAERDLSNLKNTFR